MELTLTHQTGTQVAVRCDGQPSHTFDLRTLAPDPAIPGRPPQPLADPVTYGQALYQALFPPQSPAQQALASRPDRLLLVTDTQTDAVPWEYLHGPDGFLVLDMALVRGLPADQRRAPPTLDSGLHIVAVPANPLDPAVLPLNIDGEWLRLKEVIQQVPAALTLERTRPPTLEQLRRQVVGQQQRVIHFMGHGSASDDGAVLCFEQLDGGLALVSARDFIRRTKGTTFLVTLNACVSATPGETTFANLASALVRQGTPYALGMRFVVADSDARTLSRVLYSDLAGGSSVEAAVQQVRLELANSPQPWAVGVPVLYTSLSAPAAGFAQVDGQPRISEQQPPLELFSLPRADGTFQGRQAELRHIGSRLTGDSRPRLLTIHGSGGQGKTALAREAVERFAHAFPGGVVAVSLENLPARAEVVTTLARFLGIDTETIADPAELERQVLTRLGQQRTLLVLDNAETLAQAAQAGEAEAQRLAQLMREQMPASTTLLLTSREYLGWGGEEALPLGGLDHRNGARLFAQSAPQRASDIYLKQAEALSEKVEGHPLSLRLLGSAFNDMSTPLAAFIQAHETHLLHSEDTYRDAENRHRSLYQNIDFSVRYLNDELRALLGGLWLFHAPFQPEAAVAIFDPDGDYPEGEQSPILDQLHRLMRRSLLEVETATTSEGRLLFYRLHPAVRLFAEQHLQPPDGREELLQRFGTAYANLSGTLYRGIDRSASLVVIARVCAGDLDRGLEHAPAEQQGWYALRRGWVLHRLGDRQRGLALTEQAHTAGEHDQDLKLHALNNMGEVYRSTDQLDHALQLYEEVLAIIQASHNDKAKATILNNIGAVYQQKGQPQQALTRFKAALPLRQAVGDTAGEATTLNNMGLVYGATEQPQRALALYEQALPLRRAVGDTAGEATTLNNMGLVYGATEQPQRALALYAEALPLTRAVGDTAGEATTLNNMAAVYADTGQPQRALALYKQALPLTRAVGDTAGEARTLNNMAAVYQQTGQPQRALALYEQALPITRAVGDTAGEADTLIGLAVLLYQSLNRPAEAVQYIQQAIAVLETTGLDRAASGTTIEEIRQVLATMQRGEPLGGGGGPSVSAEVMQAINALVNTAGIEAIMRQVVEAQQALLFLPEVESIFEQNIAQAISDGKQERASELQIYLDVLRLCKQQGIAATFDQFERLQTESTERGRISFWQMFLNLFRRKR